MGVQDTLLKMLAPSAPSGFEGAIAQAIEAELRPFADEIFTDAMGNLFCVKHGPGKKLMLAAHMDQIGFIVTGIDENGFLRVARLGGIFLSNVNAQHVVFSSGARGVINEEVERDGKPLEYKHLFIDVGASSKEEAEKIAQIGDWAVFAPQVSDMGKRMASPYMDNRAGCALLIEAFKKLDKPENEIIAVFTVQEELGCRGAMPAAYASQPDMGIAIDVTKTGDAPKSPYMNVKLGGGIAIKVMDTSVICHPAVRALLEKTAQEKQIPYQLEVLTAGGTDAGVMQQSRGGVPSGVLSIPCRYVHAPTETIDLGDLQGGVDLLAAVMQQKI